MDLRILTEPQQGAWHAELLAALPERPDDQPGRPRSLDDLAANAISGSAAEIVDTLSTFAEAARCDRT